MKLINKIEVKNQTSYDIEVGDTHCFFANGVLVHNSHFDAAYNNIDGLWFQSRENIITSQSDNAGSAFFGETNKSTFIGIIRDLAAEYNVNLNKNSIAIPMEWAGGNIQKGVGICNLPKSAFILAHAKVAPFSEESVNYWIPTKVSGKNVSSPDNRIYNILDYKTFEITVDFNTPLLSQNPIIDMTIAVEDECPVSKAFGFDNTIGEGIVFHYLGDNGQLYLWKSKGEKHSKSSKVKTLKPVDDEKLNKIIDVVNQVTISWRLEQALDKTFDLLNGGKIDIKKMGDFIRNVIQDVIKEESDIIAEAGLEPKDINAKISEVCRQYFFTKLNEEAGLK